MGELEKKQESGIDTGKKNCDYHGQIFCLKLIALQFHRRNEAGIVERDRVPYGGKQDAYAENSAADDRFCMFLFHDRPQIIRYIYLFMR